jgi:hypothetical protein
VLLILRKEKNREDKIYFHKAFFHGYVEASKKKETDES